MYVAWRDLKFATGRFALIGAVVALITLLVGFLSGLTVGLAVQNISAIVSLPGDHVVFSMSGTESPAYADSAVTAREAAVWQSRAGVRSVEPLGILQAKLSTSSSRGAAALFGSGTDLSPNVPSSDGTIVLSSTVAKDLHVAAGDAVSIAGASYSVARLVDDEWYSHTAVAWMTLHDWRLASTAMRNPASFATVLLVSGSTDAGAADKSAGTESTSIIGSLTALAAFRSEIGSLALIVGMLFAISALVVGSFFTVWSIQRKPDFAVLKALGASNGSLHVDALGQAAVLLIAGVGVGIALTAVLGALAASALPFVLSPLTTVLPGIAMIGFGLLGAAIATQSVTRADPLTALGSAR